MLVDGTLRNLYGLRACSIFFLRFFALLISVFTRSRFSFLFLVTSLRRSSFCREARPFLFFPFFPMQVVFTFVWSTLEEGRGGVGCVFWGGGVGGGGRLGRRRTGRAREESGKAHQTGT